MRINKAQLLRAVPNTYKPNLDTFVASFNKYSDMFYINTPLRVVHFLAQVFHESGCLRYVEENLHYSADGLLKTFPKYFKTREKANEYANKPEKIANCVYANRMGNGSESSGDGWKYIGRGYIMITGKEQYQKYANSGFCVGDLVSNPEWLCDAPGNLKSSMWFWWKSKCNRYADLDDCRGVTKCINGGLNGFATRQYYLRRFKREFGL